MTAIEIKQMFLRKNIENFIWNTLKYDEMPLDHDDLAELIESCIDTLNLIDNEKRTDNT